MKNYFFNLRTTFQTRTLLLFALAAFLLSSCKKKESTPEPAPAPTPVVPVPTPTVPTTPTVTPTNTLLPTLSTLTVSAITDTTAKCGGNVTAEGAGVILAVGICWDEQPAPTLLKSKTVDGAGTGSYSSAMKDLKPATTYYVRAYASNMHGTAYGNELSFTTPKTPKWTGWGGGLNWGTNARGFVTIGNDVFVATDNQGILKGSSSVNNWVPVNSGITDFYINCLTLKGNGMFAGTSSDGVLYSSNNGASWTTKNAGLANTSVADIAVSGSNLFLSDGMGIYTSSDDGGIWTNVSPSGFLNPALLTTVGSSVFFVDYNGNFPIYMSSNNGGSWSTIPAIPSNPSIQSLKGIGNALFAATSDGLYTTSNNGSTWTKLSNGLPSGNLFSIDSNNGNLYAGFSSGIYTSSDNGATWSKAGYGLPANIYPSFFGFSQSTIFISGPGIYKLD